MSLPAYLGDAIRHCLSSAVNLWVWAHCVETRSDVGGATYYIYPRDLALGGPKLLNGCRVVVEMRIEQEASHDH